MRLGYDVRRKLIFEKGQTVAQREFSLLEPLDLQPVAGTKMEQCLDRGIEVAILTQTLELGQQRASLPLSAFSMKLVAEMTANAGLKQGGRFQKGQSGNPAGRAHGSRHHATLLAEKLLDGQVELLAQKAVDLALEGDVTALRLCLERILPARKDRPVIFTLPDIEAASDITKALGVIAKAMAAGELTPEEAVTVAAVIETQRKAIEMVEVDERLQKIEARIGIGK